MVTTAEILTAIQPFLTESNKINPGNPMITSYGAGQIYIYKLPTNPPAIVYTTSAAVDCDGQPNPLCATDPTNQSATSCSQSDGKPLDPVNLPWYVIPETPNPFFNYPDYGISCGQVGLCIYGTRMQYGVFGDERGRDVGNANGQMIGEVSYAMANALGINPDPAVGGVESGVTYIIFTGGQNVANPIENPASSVSIGTSALNAMLAELSGGGGGAGYNCVNGNCQYAASGAQYGTLAECQAACTTGGGAGYNCVNGVCQYAASGAQYGTLADCQSVCTGGGGGACTADQFLVPIIGKCYPKTTVYAAGAVIGLGALFLFLSSRKKDEYGYRGRY